MTRFVILLAVALTLPVVTTDLPTAYANEVQQAESQLERCRHATVRVRASGSLGTGTFFLEDADNYYVLTNSHVAGSVGARVKVEMWYRGYLSNPVAGTVTYSVRKRNYYRDIAIIKVPKENLKGYRPPVIPLAPEDYEPDYSRIYSFGCGSGSWLTNWEGHAFRRDQSSGDVINFFPQPAGGRSGSGIFSADGKYIIALIAWRSQAGQHSKDGANENPEYHGIAMTKDEVRDAFKGIAPTNYVPVTPEPLQLPESDAARTAPASTNSPKVLNDGLEEIDWRTAKDHGAESVLGDNTLIYKDLPRLVPTNETKDLFPGILRRKGQQSPQPSPPNDQDANPMFNLPENMQERFEGLKDDLKERQEERQEERKERLEDTPQPSPDPNQGEPKFDAPEPEQSPQQDPQQDPQEEGSPEDTPAPEENAGPAFQMRDLVDLVLIMAALTGLWCWIRRPLTAVLTSAAVIIGADAVRTKLDKRDNK